MHKILIINQFGQQETVDLPGIPRVGDTIPVFYNPSPKVNAVFWMPEKVFPDLEGFNFDVVLTVG